MTVFLLVLLSMGIPTHAKVSSEETQNDVAAELAGQLRRCVDLVAAGPPTRTRLLEVFGVPEKDVGRGKELEFEGQAFSAEIDRADPANLGAFDISVYPKQHVRLNWRLIKAWAPRWKTIVAGETTMVQARLKGAGAGAAVVATVRLLLSPKKLEGRVLSVALRRE